VLVDFARLTRKTTPAVVPQTVFVDKRETGSRRQRPGDAVFPRTPERPQRGRVCRQPPDLREKLCGPANRLARGAHTNAGQSWPFEQAT
jgi:hypothetical protein